MANFVSQDGPDDLLFTIQVRLLHPSAEADSISKEFGLEPDRMWSAGEPRATPGGTPLRGRHEKTYWTFSYTVFGKRLFFESVNDCLEKMAKHRMFLNEFRRTGGETSIIIGLSGEKNIGDIIDASKLVKIGEAGFSLGVEVFPELKAI